MWDKLYKIKKNCLLSYKGCSSYSNLLPLKCDVNKKEKVEPLRKYTLEYLPSVYPCQLGDSVLEGIIVGAP